MFVKKLKIRKKGLANFEKTKKYDKRTDKFMKKIEKKTKYMLTNFPKNPK